MLIKMDCITYGHKIYDLADASLTYNKDPITGYYSAEAFLEDLETMLRYDPVKVYVVDTKPS